MNEAVQLALDMPGVENIIQLHNYAWRLDKEAARNGALINVRADNTKRWTPQIVVRFLPDGTQEAIERCWYVDTKRGIACSYAIPENDNQPTPAHGLSLPYPQIGRATLSIFEIVKSFIFERSINDDQEC